MIQFVLKNSLYELYLYRGWMILVSTFNWKCYVFLT